MFKLKSSDVTTHAIIDILHPMAATNGEFIRHDALCKVAVTHARSFLGVLLIDGKGNSFLPNDHERQLVLDHYKPKELKYKYLYVIQGDFGQGWEDVEEIDKHGKGKEESCATVNGKPYTPLRYVRYQIALYRESQPDFSYRIINRRVLNGKES